MNAWIVARRATREGRVLVLATAAMAAFAGVAGPAIALAASNDRAALIFSAVQGGLAVVYAAVGARITWARPRHPIGWMLLAVGLCQGVSAGAFEYGTWAGETGRPLAAEAIWLSNWVWAPSLALLTTFIPLLFPDGHLPSRRWRPLALVAGIATIAGTAANAVPLWGARAAVLTGETPDLPTAAAVSAVATAVTAAAGLACIGSLFVRFRRARGRERAQLKWFIAGGVTTAIAVASTFAMPGVDLGSAAGLAFTAVLFLALCAAPTSVGVAVLRYRLFEIDRLVSRTVSYTVVTGVLGTLYVSAVVVLGRVVPDGGSDLIVAGSTLLVAGSSAPLLRRVRSAVDRRFDRARYDAIRTLDELAERLRREVDLAELHRQIVTTVSGTLAPSSAQLWLRPPDRS